jgi:activating signal cointegrator 1
LLENQLPVVTLHQPWASLVLVGAKAFETRSWAPPVRLIGRSLGIHAGQTVVRRLPPDLAAAVVGLLGHNWIETVPTGRLLCITRVWGAWMTGERIGDGNIATVRAREGSPPLPGFREDLFGDYAPGRWIWGLEQVTVVKPLPARGRQRVWSLPADELNRQPANGDGQLSERRPEDSVLSES